MIDSLDTSLTNKIQSISILGSFLLLVFIIYLIRKEKLREGYAIIWLAVVFLLLIFSGFTNLLYKFADLLGIYYVPAALFLVLVVGLILLSIHYSVIITAQEKRIKELAQEISLMGEKIKKRSN